MTDRSCQSLAFALMLAFVVAQAVFAAFPGVDLAFSGLFAAGAAGFPLADGPASSLNLILRRMGEMAAIALVLWCVYGGVAGLLQHGALRAWLYAAACVTLSSGAIVNLLLKSHVGRARPDIVAEFGGNARFTPAWQVTDQCSRNCSFTSGEVALATSLALVALVLLWPRLVAARRCVAACVLAGVYIAVVSLLRIGLGRHFLSDAVFSILISASVALVLYPVLGVARARQGFDAHLPVILAARWVASARALAAVWLKRAT